MNEDRPDSVCGLYRRTKQAFPVIAERADRIHMELWSELDGYEYSWFESLANALNAEMRRDVDYGEHQALFDFIDRALGDSQDEVYRCIDVAFVENLFWEVPHAQCKPYWMRLPARLRQLYLDFHRHEP